MASTSAPDAPAKSPRIAVNGAAARTIPTAPAAGRARSTSVSPRSSPTRTTGPDPRPVGPALRRPDQGGLPSKCDVLAATTSRRRSSATRRHGPGRGRDQPETFEGLAQSRGYLYLRDLLAAVGVLAPYEARIERMILVGRALGRLAARTRQPGRAIRALEGAAAPAQQGRPGRVDQGGDPSARTRSGAPSPYSPGWTSETSRSPLQPRPTSSTTSPSGAKKRPMGSINSSTGYARRESTRRWKSRVPSGSPSVTMSDADRWRHVELLLHDTTIRHSTRIGGLFCSCSRSP